jgi:hypothetical protein
MIGRIWHGWTTLERADAYEDVMRCEVIPSIVAKKVEGFERIEMFRRRVGTEVEFVTIMTFGSLDAVRKFAGDDYESAYVPPRARSLLERFDARSQHYEVRVRECG